MVAPEERAPIGRGGEQFGGEWAGFRHGGGWLAFRSDPAQGEILGLPGRAPEQPCQDEEADCGGTMASR